MKAILVNYNFTPDWLKDYPELDYVIFDRSDSKEWLKDFPQDKIIYTVNKGNADLDKLDWLIDSYYNLPDVFLWGKTNLFKYISKEEFDKVKDNTTFTPLLTQNHKTYSDRIGAVCYYADGIYYERNDNWYVSQFSTRFDSLNDFARYLSLPPLGNYVPFPPGGNFILTRDRVHKFGIELYEKMRDSLLHSVLPAEAHFCERIYYTLWQS